MANKIKLLESQELGRIKHLTFCKDTFIGINGVRSEMGVVRHPGAVVIIPRLASGDFILLRQHRYALNDFIFEFPAGSLDRELESPQHCAEREIIEETGYRAKTWASLGYLHPAPGFTDEVQHLFFAQDLSPQTAAGDEDEVIEVFTFTHDQINLMIISGELSDAKSIAAFYRAKLLGLI